MIDPIAFDPAKSKRETIAGLSDLLAAANKLLVPAEDEMARVEMKAVMLRKLVGYIAIEVERHKNELAMLETQ